MQNKCIRFFLKLDKMHHICDTLRDLVSVITLRLYDRLNAHECMLTLFSTSLLFLFVCLSYYGVQASLSDPKTKWVRSLNMYQSDITWMLLIDFEVS